jgi:hypothetical protein
MLKYMIHKKLKNTSEIALIVSSNKPTDGKCGKFGLLSK